MTSCSKCDIVRLMMFIARLKLNKQNMVTCYKKYSDGI